MILSAFCPAKNIAEHGFTAHTKSFLRSEPTYIISSQMNNINDFFIYLSR